MGGGARAGDALAHELIDRAMAALAAGVASAINLLDVEAVVVGGGLGTRFGQPYADRLLEEMRPHLFVDERPPVVLAAALGDLGGAIGATLIVPTHDPVAVSAAPPSYAEPSILRLRNVRLLLGAELFASATSTALTTTLGWQGFQRTHSPLTLGLIGLAEFVPAVLFVIPAGQLADRVDRRFVTAGGLLAAGVTAFALALDAAAGDHAAWPLYAFALVLGSAQAFAQPSFNPLLAAAVDVLSLPRVIALSAVTWQAASVIGPAASGLAQRFSNPGPYIGVGVGCLLGASLVLALTPELGRSHIGEQTRPSTLREAFGGVRLILRRARAARRDLARPDGRAVRRRDGAPARVLGRRAARRRARQRPAARRARAPAPSWSV